MFPIIESFNSNRIDREYAENRKKWEPLYEVTHRVGGGGVPQKSICSNALISIYLISPTKYPTTCCVFRSDALSWYGEASWLRRQT